MSTLIWSYIVQSGLLERVPSDIARLRRVFADPDARDRDCEVEFRRVADAPARAWQPPAYPRADEED